MKTSDPSRRNFIRNSAAGAAALGLTSMLLPQNAEANPRRPAAEGANSPAHDLFNAPISSSGEYELPDLPYAYDALEPAIDEQTMRLHHGIHFNGYKNGLNNALKKLAECRENNDFALVQHWEKQLAFHGAGYMLHLVFFAGMAPYQSSQPSDKLEKRIAHDFGSLSAMKAQFKAASSSVEGSGWGILGYQPVGNRMIILQAEKHQNLTQWGVIPLLALDVWEHAYYLNYQNKRPAYIDAFWSVVDWAVLEKRINAVENILQS